MSTKSSASNQRRHIRFRDPDGAMVNFYVMGSSGSKTYYKALIYNESISGLALLFVDENPIEADSIIYWQESSAITTPCEVIRCSELHEHVFLLAVRLADK